eukprot:7080769-Lingulodinium_polyedra.AAC.1
MPSGAPPARGCCSSAPGMARRPEGSQSHSRASRRQRAFEPKWLEPEWLQTSGDAPPKNDLFR